MEFYLERLDKRGGSRIRLPEGTVSIGRHPKSTIVLCAADRCASGFHAVIYVDAQRLLLQDMQSTNGTFVNGRQVQECVLGAGDEVGLGRSGPRFRVVRREAAEGLPGGGFGVDGGIGVGAGAYGGDDGGDIDDINDIDDDLHINSINTPAETLRQRRAERAAPSYGRIITIAALISVLTVIGLLVLLIPFTCLPPERPESSPGKKNFFSVPAEESTPTSTPGPTSTQAPATTAERISAILVRFGEEDGYRAPPEMVERVDHYLAQYTGRMRRTIAGYMERKKRFFPMIHRIFAERNIPPELAYVAMLESGFNTTARSHAGAVGLWQFMPATARRYGLEVSPHIDERTDPEKATYAAAAYFKDLIAIFGSKSSVMLCMAAYNAGEARVISALKRIDDPVRNRDFWYLYRMGWLPEETNEYIPQIIALMIISENLAEFGFAE